MVKTPEVLSSNRRNIMKRKMEAANVNSSIDEISKSKGSMEAFTTDSRTNMTM